METGFRDKYKESLVVAGHCENNKQYANSISRYYYSVLQLILFILHKHGYTIGDILQGSSHVVVKESFVKFAHAKNGFDFYKFSSTFEMMKKFRNKADYKKEQIDSIDFKQFKEAYNFIFLEVTKYES